MPRPTLSVRLLAFALPLTLATTAHAESIFLGVTGQIQGVIRSWYNPVDELDGMSLADYGAVEDMAWSVVSPRDAASGLPTGKRQHRGLTVRARMSAATPLLGNALTNNENLPSVELVWFAPDPESGEVEKTRRMYLVNANISSLSVYTTREGLDLVTYMDVAFTYQKIGIEDTAAGLSYEDDWESPVAAPTIE